MPELFAAVADAAPDAPAVIDEGEVWSYRRLDEASNRLAWRLISLGVGRETPVGVALDRSAELLVALLGILKAGGVYVPLDPGYPDERLAFMLADTAAPVVVVEGRSRERLEGLTGPARLLCLGPEEIHPDASRPPVRVLPEELAYVIYTSGSTGRPKGVAVPHRAIARLVRETDYAQLGPGDRVAHLSNTSFDAATFEIWGALLNGAAVVIVPRAVALAPEELAGRLRRRRRDHDVPDHGAVQPDGAGGARVPLRRCATCSSAARRSIRPRSPGCWRRDRRSGCCTSTARPRAPRSPPGTG